MYGETTVSEPVEEATCVAVDGALEMVDVWLLLLRLLRLTGLFATFGLFGVSGVATVALARGRRASTRVPALGRRTRRLWGGGGIVGIIIVSNNRIKGVEGDGDVDACRRAQQRKRTPTTSAKGQKAKGNNGESQGSFRAYAAATN